MSQKTDTEIQAEIAQLTGCKAYAPHFTIFGEDNWAGIDAQIDVLKEGLDEDQAQERFEPLEGGGPVNVVEAATNAVRWREGDENESPSSGWDSFKKADAAVQSLARTARATAKTVETAVTKVAANALQSLADSAQRLAEKHGVAHPTKRAGASAVRGKKRVTRTAKKRKP
jgi:hypothetical protein